jgi:hypothetical protein
MVAGLAPQAPTHLPYLLTPPQTSPALASAAGIIAARPKNRMKKKRDPVMTNPLNSMNCYVLVLNPAEKFFDYTC